MTKIVADRAPERLSRVGSPALVRTDPASLRRVPSLRGLLGHPAETKARARVRARAKESRPEAKGSPRAPVTSKCV